MMITIPTNTEYEVSDEVKEVVGCLKIHKVINSKAYAIRDKDGSFFKTAIESYTVYSDVLEVKYVGLNHFSHVDYSGKRIGYQRASDDVKQYKISQYGESKDYHLVVFTDEPNDPRVFLKSNRKEFVPALKIVD